MRLSLATALSLTALAGSAQANWFHKDPKRASPAVSRARHLAPAPPLRLDADGLPSSRLAPADYSKWDVDTLTTYLKEKNLNVPAGTPSRDELSVLSLVAQPSSVAGG